MPPPKDPPRDRDDRKTIQPPARVLEQIATRKPARGDETPIESPPSKLNPDRPAESRVQVKDLDDLRLELKEWVLVDERQHEDIRKTVEKLGDKLNESDKNQGKLMVETAKQSLSLNALVDESSMTRAKKDALEIAKAQAEIRTQEHATISRRDLKYYVIRGVIGIAIGAGTLAIEHLLK